MGPLLGCILLVLQARLSVAQESGVEYNQECSSTRWGQFCPTETKLAEVMMNAEQEVVASKDELGRKLEHVRLQSQDKLRRLNFYNDAFHAFQNNSQHLRRSVDEVDIISVDSSIIEGAHAGLVKAENHLREAEESTHSFSRSCSRAQIPESKTNRRLQVLSGRDCADIHKKGGRESGFYYIRPARALASIKAYCDMDDRGGGWTMIQRRIDATTDFDQDWETYKWGFGNKDKVEAEHWLGNEYIHLLTTQNITELQIDLVARDGTKRYALYKYFQVDSDENNYRLLKINGYFMDQNGDVGDAFSQGAGFSCSNFPVSSEGTGHKFMSFTTKDRDNDRDPTGNCAGHSRGGWWYNHCLSANLNGKMRDGNEYAELAGRDTDGMVWTTWRGCWESLKESRMKIRPFGFWPDEAPILPMDSEIRRRLLNNNSKLSKRLQRRRMKRHLRRRSRLPGSRRK